MSFVCQDVDMKGFYVLFNNEANKIFCIYALLYTVTTVSLSLNFYGLLVYNMQHLVYH